jgi:S1-C subfamily serine protease
MKVCLLAAVAVLWFPGVACRAQPSNSSKPLSEEQRRRSIESVELVWSTVRNQHWDPDLLRVNWDAARTRALESVRGAASMDTVRRALWEMISLFGESHFAIIPGDLYAEIRGSPRSHRAQAEHPTPEKDRDVARKPERDESWTPGIVATVIDGRAVVVEVERSSPAESAGIRPGWLLEAIDGHPLASVLTLFRDSSTREREALQAQFLAHQLNGPPEEKTEVLLRDGAGRSRS